MTKRIQAFVWMCILFVSVNGYAVESRTTTTKKISPTTIDQVKAGTLTPPIARPTQIKLPIQPATGYTPEPTGDVQGYVPETPAPPSAPPGQEQIGPDRERQCPDGYYCMARLGGTSVWCQWGTAPESYDVPNPKDCNAVANYCRAHREDIRYCE